MAKARSVPIIKPRGKRYACHDFSRAPPKSPKAPTGFKLKTPRILVAKRITTASAVKPNATTRAAVIDCIIAQRLDECRESTSAMLRDDQEVRSPSSYNEH